MTTACGQYLLLGKGLFSGSQSQLQFLPAQHTDLIFAVLGEEHRGVRGGAAEGDEVTYLPAVTRVSGCLSKRRRGGVPLLAGHFGRAAAVKLAHRFDRVAALAQNLETGLGGCGLGRGDGSAVTLDCRKRSRQDYRRRKKEDTEECGPDRSTRRCHIGLDSMVRCISSI